VVVNGVLFNGVEDRHM